MDAVATTTAGAPASPPGPEVPRDGRVRVVVGHRSPFLRDGLLLALGAAPGVHVVGVARDADELDELIGRMRPDVSLITPELRPAGSPAGLLVMVDSLEDDRIGELYAAGARCVVPADIGRERLIGLLHRVATGERIVLEATQEQLERRGITTTERSAAATGAHPAPPPLVPDAREGLVVSTAARTLIFTMALVAALSGLGGLPHPAATWALVASIGIWALISAYLVRSPPSLPPWGGMAVDLAFAAGLGLSFADARGTGVPLAVLLVTFALRAPPRMVLLAAGAAVVDFGAVVLSLSAANGLARVVAFVAVSLVAVMIAVVRDRREREFALLVEARRELLAEALSAEVRARRRIAEELHDDPLQLLLAAKQELDELDEDPEAAGRAIELVAEASTRLRAVMQRSTTERPVTGRLRDALEELCEHHARRGGYGWAVAVGPGVDTVLHELLHALAAELVINVAKHARASRLTVRVSARDEGAELVVSDDGVGVPAGRLEAAAHDGHLGMRATRRRVDAAQGTLEITSSPEAGTEVRAWLPSPVRR